MTTWDPGLYLKFGGERTRPAADLLARVPLAAPERVVDLGCGPGNSTALLAARFPNADIVGIDSSEAMLREARGAGVKARFEPGDFETWAPAEAPDLIYANAALHWAADPVSTTARLFKTLAPGGVLALQVPQNFDQPSHLAIQAAIAEGPWRAQLQGVRRLPKPIAAHFARALAALGAELDVWSTEYLHILDGADPVLRWVSGTALRPYADKLAGEARAAFEAEVRTRLVRAYPPEPDGRTFFPFLRLFVVAKAGVSS